MKRLSLTIVRAAPVLARFIHSKNTLRQLTDTIHTAGPRANIDQKDLHDVINAAEESYAQGTREPLKRESTTIMREETLNLQLRNYVTNCRKLLDKKNSIADQLQLNVRLDPTLLRKGKQGRLLPQNNPVHCITSLEFQPTASSRRPSNFRCTSTSSATRAPSSPSTRHFRRSNASLTSSCSSTNSSELLQPWQHPTYFEFVLHVHVLPSLKLSRRASADQQEVVSLT